MLITEVIKPKRYKSVKKSATVADIKQCPYYFAYGMNTHSENMMIRTGDSIDLGRAMLPDFRLEFIEFCDVQPDSSNDVVGVLWKMSPAGLAQLDVREGYPTHYDRKIMNVMTGADGRDCPAWVYYMTPRKAAAGLYPPSEHYWNTVNAGYREHGVQRHQLLDAYERAWDFYEENYPPIVNDKDDDDYYNNDFFSDDYRK
jgi:gamma-glutamylcyclotransferase (GGCT)/AIG2-like uncharacterized protein YtfP